MTKLKKMKVSDGARMYSAGQASRLSASWGFADYTADQVVFAQLEALRARAREQFRNNDYVSRLIQMLQNNVVGASGFKLRSQVVDRKGEADLPVRRLLEQAWSDFAEASDLTLICQLMIAAFVTDGEAFFYMRESKGELFPELIDPALIDVAHNEELNNGNIVTMGIEYSPSSMKPVAYHVGESYEKNSPSAGVTKGKRTRVPAEEILHLFKKNFVGQKRGIPWISVSLSRLFQLGRYEEAALTAARIGAAKMGFFTSREDDEYLGDESGDEMTMNAEAGTFENIGSLDFKTFDPSYPAGEFEGFMTKTLQGIASGLGVDYHSLGNDLAKVNYSSARVGMLETREYFKTLQSWMISKLMKPLFMRWLKLRLFYQDLKINDKALNRGLFYYLPSEFVGRRWEWVDPQKEANAKRIQYEMRTISISQIIRERGDDPDQVFKEIADERAQMKKLGILPEEVLQAIGGEEIEQEDS